MKYYFYQDEEPRYTSYLCDVKGSPLPHLGWFSSRQQAQDYLDTLFPEGDHRILTETEIIRKALTTMPFEDVKAIIYENQEDEIRIMAQYIAERNLVYRMQTITKLMGKDGLK
jgi:hypothetical protein